MGNGTVLGVGPGLVVKYGDPIRLSEAMEYIAREHGHSRAHGIEGI